MGAVVALVALTVAARPADERDQYGRYEAESCLAGVEGAMILVAALFARVGELVPVALAALDRGGTLALAGIHVTEIPALDYRRHLF